MSPEHDSTGHVQRQVERAKQWTRTFHASRDTWAKLMRRELAVVLQPEITGSLEPVEYRTPDILQAMHDFVDVLVMNNTYLDVAPLQERTPTVEKKLRRILLWGAALWAQQLNEGRKWDISTGEGQSADGVAFSRLLYKEQGDPDKGEEEEADAYLVRRDKEHRARRSNVFSLVDVDRATCHWVESPGAVDVFFQDYDLPLLEAQESFSKLVGGKPYKPTIDSAGKLGWLGEDEAPDTSAAWRKLRVVVREARNLEGRMCPVCTADPHPVWTCTEYVMGPGQTWPDAEELESYDSPFPGCSYFVTPGRRSNSRDLNERYTPMLYRLYVEGSWINYLNTLVATKARTEMGPESLYADLSAARPQLGAPEGGTGVDVMLKRPEPGSNEIMGLAGEIKLMPNVAPEYLRILLEQAFARFEAAKPNRFITDPDPEEAARSTSTAWMQGSQAAGLQFGRLLSQSDMTIKRILRYVVHAIKMWSYGLPPEAQARYYLSTSGDETIRAGSVEAGELVYVDAETLDVEFDWVVKTESVTLQEEGARWAQAKDKWMAGVMALDEFIKAGGNRDVEGFRKEKRRDKIRALMEPKKEAAVSQIITMLTASLVQVPPEFLAPAPQLPAPQPAQNGGGETVGSMTGRQMQPALVPGPRGGADGA